MNFVLGGFYFAKGVRTQLQCIEEPNLKNLEDLLAIVENKSAVLSMELKTNHVFGNSELTVYCENHEYLIIHGYYTDDGDYQVLTLNDAVSKGMKTILGEMYPANSIVKDFRLIKDVFTYFLVNKEPSTLLTMT